MIHVYNTIKSEKKKSEKKKKELFFKSRVRMVYNSSSLIINFKQDNFF